MCPSVDEALQDPLTTCSKLKLAEAVRREDVLKADCGCAIESDAISLLTGPIPEPVLTDRKSSGDARLFAPA